MLGLTLEDIRLFLHVVSATIWVGGQLTLVALVPVLRGVGADIPKIAARRFAQVAWPAFGVLVATGVWNMIAEKDELVGDKAVTLRVKMVFVVVSGVAAFLHARATSKKAIAISGSLTGVSALIALFFGVQIAAA